MSVIAWFGEATVVTVNPLTVRMPQASTAQPAKLIGATAPTVGATVAVSVTDGGVTYVHGPVT